MPSCLLFHGPSSRSEALTRAGEIGRLIYPPVGDEGLSTEDARAITEWTQIAPVGSQIGVLIIGPIDRAKHPAATDALLKSLEEFDEEKFLPILWAWDVGDVPATIRSRSLMEWCPGEIEIDADTRSVASRMIETACVKDIAGLITNLPDEISPLLAQALAVRIREKLPDSLDLWLTFREGMHMHPTRFEVLASLLPSAP